VVVVWLAVCSEKERLQEAMLMVEAAMVSAAEATAAATAAAAAAAEAEVAAVQADIQALQSRLDEQEAKHLEVLQLGPCQCHLAAVSLSEVLSLQSASVDCGNILQRAAGP
jgi:hypothetical protein